MFSTLLGALPALQTHPDSAPGPGDDRIDDTPTALAEAGLELVSTGEPPAGADLAPEVVVARWLRAAGASQRPLKQVLAGPYSAGRDGPSGRPTQLAEALRPMILALAEAGCPFVEIDEPDALAIAVVAGERRRFVEAHRRLLDGVGAIHVSLAMTGGNHDAAGPATFFDLPYASYAFDLIDGPDDWRLIAAAPRDRGIVCGALDPRPGGSESPETLVWAARYAASTGGRGLDRVGLANGPSLAGLPRGEALAKLRRVADAARIAAAATPRELAEQLDPLTFGRPRPTTR